MTAGVATTLGPIYHVPTRRASYYIYIIPVLLLSRSMGSMQVAGHEGKRTTCFEKISAAAGRERFSSGTTRFTSAHLGVHVSLNNDHLVSGTWSRRRTANHPQPKGLPFLHGGVWATVL